MDVAGQDATEAFEDVGHSDEAREILTNLLVGKLKRQVRVLASFARSLLLQYPCTHYQQRFHLRNLFVHLG